MIGRKEEIGILEDLLNSKKPEFLALYGRRRIGKTYLEPFSIDAEYEKKLIHKVEALRTETGTKKALWLTMITFSGLSDNQYKNCVVSELVGDDLFQ